MSLHHIAQHLKDQGRGPDDMLVHMTSGEVKALQGLAQAHGGSLSINPKTGLPEAGFLSTILPMAAGALAVASGQVEFLPLIAAGVGVADYALTGSLTQGLMAGLGTWSGGTLAGGLAGAGAAELAAEGANQSTVAFEAAQNQAATAALPQGYNPATSGFSPTEMLQGSNPGVVKDLAGQQLTAMNAPPLFNEAVANAPVDQVGNIIKGAGANAVNPTFSQGLTQGISSPSAIGQTLMNNKMAALGVAAPLLTSSNLLGTKKGPIPGVTQQTSSNPFGMKTIPRDSNGNPIFNASLPAQPNPPYQATYPNYVQNPYNAYGAAEGGVMKMAIGGSAPLVGTPAANSTMNSTMGNNSMFPMSEMARSYYATPTQMPAGTTQDSSMPGYGPRLDTNTGQMMNNFADGGMAGLPYMQQQQNQPATANGYTPAGGGSTYGQGQFSPQTNPMPPTGLQQMNQMGMPPAQFAQGGVAQYAGKYESMVSGLQDIKEGADIATRRPVMETPRSDPGIYEDESDVRNLDSYNRTLALLKKNLTASHVKPSKGLPKSAALGAIDLTPTTQAAAEQQAKASIVKESDTSEAKEGGLMGYAMGGHLGGYSDGGHLLRGPGDGVSDSIPATIGGKQPARLAEGEFVIPARIVSELGNGSTDAGAKRLYAMMDRIKAKRSKTKNIAADTKAYKYLPA